jgi:hypothetical protein
VLVLAGAGAFVVVRRRRAGGAAAPGLFGTLKARFAARARAPHTEAPERRATEPAEPTLE